MKNIFIYLILTLFLVVTIEYISGRDFSPFFPKKQFQQPILRKQLGANGVTLYYPISTD